MSDLVRRLDRPEWNFFAEACKLQSSLGAFDYTEIRELLCSSPSLPASAALPPFSMACSPESLLR